MYILKQRVHPTWMLTVLCVGLLAGVACARLCGPVTPMFAIAGGVAILFCFWRQHAWMFALMLCGGMLVGLWRGGLEMQGLSVYKSAIGTTTTITGIVSADPQMARGKQAVSLDAITAGGRRIAGTVYATTNETPVLRRGDVVTLHGKVTDGHGNYAASMYLASIKKAERPNNVFLDIRDSFSAALRAVIAEPMASLGVGILAGQKSELPSDFSDALKVAGLTHIVVASGYNLTILVRLARKLFEKISKYQAAVWSVAMILAFMAITGWSASMTRAGLVAGLSLWAWYYGRKFHPVTLLAVAAAVTVLYYPPYAWGDIGWALSFAAFAGVIVLAPLLQAYFYGDKKPAWPARVLVETVSAQILTLPIMLVVFGQFSVVALLSNVLILSLVPLAMLLTFVAGLTQIIIPLLSFILAWPATILLGYMVWVVNWTASFPWAQIRWQMPGWGIVVSYAGIIAVCMYLKRRTGYDLRQVNIVE